MSNKPRFQRLIVKWQKMAADLELLLLWECHQGAMTELRWMIDNVGYSRNEVDRQRAYFLVLDKELNNRTNRPIDGERDEPR
jgi:hypothetical protein